MDNKVSYKIRLAKAKDADDCIKLSKTSWPKWWAKNKSLGERHIRRCISNKTCLVATANRGVIAFLVWGILWNKIHLQDIFVNKDFRRIGLGTHLIRRATKIAENQGFKEIMSDCDTSNKVSIAFHLKNNFKRHGLITDNWGKEDSIVFSKKI